MAPFPSNRHLSSGDCTEDKRKVYQNLHCAAVCITIINALMICSHRWTSLGFWLCGFLNRDQFDRLWWFSLYFSWMLQISLAVMVQCIVCKECLNIQFFDKNWLDYDRLRDAKCHAAVIWKRVQSRDEKFFHWRLQLIPRWWYCNLWQNEDEDQTSQPDNIWSQKMDEYAFITQQWLRVKFYLNLFIHFSTSVIKIHIKRAFLC